MNSTATENSDTPLIDATVILFIPFIFIPSSIVGVRLFKYFYRLYKARLYGIENAKELLQNPLTQLGLGKEEIAIRKENRRILKTQLKLELKNKIQKQESDSLLGRQVIAAEQYFEVLKEHSMKTWYDKLSPSAVRTFLETSKYARWWMFLQLTVTILSIGNYISLTYLTNSNDINGQSIIKTMDMIYPIVFFIDYSLGFYISDDKLKFYSSPLALISLLSIVTPYVNLFAETPTKYVWLLGFVRIFRAIRLLKIYELLSYAQTETSKQLTLFALNFFCFIFFSTSIINATEELNFALETASMNGTSCDLVPTNTVSRSVMTVLILVAMSYIPWHVFKVIDLFNSKNKFQRNPFKSKRGKAHTFFAFDSESSIVLLFEQTPDLNIRNLIANPLYQSRIKYVQGNSLDMQDLQRAVVERATALFLIGELQNQKSSLFSSAETKLLQKAMFIKRNYPGLPIFALVDYKKSKSICKDYGVEIVACANEIKAKLSSSNCIYPGVQSLITNLFQPFNEFEFSSSSEKWIKEYQCGVANQVHIINVPLGFIGLSFVELVKEFYTSRNILVIGKRTRKSSFQAKINLNSILEADDSIYCITDESEESLIQIGLEYEDPVQVNKHTLVHPIETRLDIAKTSILETSSEPKIEFFGNPQSTEANSPVNYVPHSLNGHVVLAGNLNLELISLFVSNLKSLCSEISIVVVYSNELKQDTDFKGLLAMKGVYLLLGHLSLETVMEKSNLNQCKNLIMYSEATDPETIYLVKILKTIYPNLEMNVELYNGSNLEYFENNNWENDISNIKTKSVINTCALNLSERKSYYSSIRNRVKQQNLVSHFLQFFFTKGSLKKSTLQDRQSEVTDLYLNRINDMNKYDEIGRSADYQLQRAFASGKISTSTFSSAFLAHAYFKPYLIPVLHGLISEIQLVEIEQVCVGRTFVELFERLIVRGHIALGLYRYNSNSTNANELLQNPLAHLGIGKQDTTFTKEIRRIQKTRLKLELENQKRKQENDALLGKGKPLAAPIIAAEQYFEVLKSHSMKTWYEILSPSAIRKFLETSPYARWWMFLQLLVTILSIGNYVSLTYLANSNDINDQNIIKTLDMVYSSVFFVDYILAFYISEDKLKFYCTIMSLIDLLSIVTPYIYLFVVSPTKFVWFIGFVRVFRAVRILKIYRILSFAQTETTRELTVFALNFFTFIFFSTSLINATEALDFGQAVPSMKNWHDAFTAGSDLVPTSTVSRVIVMILIIMAIVYIPWQTSKVIEVFNSQNIFQRSIFKPKENTSHIIITGEINYSIIIHFARQFFLFDDESSIVILFDKPPSLDVRKLLNQPLYRSRLHYLQGDIFSLSDLSRAQIQNATAFFILQDTSKQEKNRSINIDDAKTLQLAMFVKSHFAGLPIFAQVFDNKTMQLCSNSGIERVCCVNEVKAGLSGLNCLQSGAQTLVMNLAQTFKDYESVISNERWVKEYQCGMSNQVQPLKTPLGLQGVKLKDAVKEVFSSFNAIIIAIKSESPGEYGAKIQFSPNRNYRLKEDDILFCVGDVTDENLLRMHLYYEQTYKKQELEYIDLESEMEKKSVLPLVKTKTKVIASKFEEFDYKSDSVPLLENHIVVSGQASPSMLQSFIQHLRSSKSPESETPLVIINDGVSENDLVLWEKVIKHSNVYLLTGHLSFDSTIEKANLAKCKRLVLFSESNDSQTIYLIKFLKSKFAAINFMVELYDGSAIKYFVNNIWENNFEHLKTKTIVDNCSLNVSERISFYNSSRADTMNQNTIAQVLKFFFTKESLKQDDEINLIENQKEKKIETGVTDMYLQKITNMNNVDEIQNSNHYQVEYSFATGSISTGTFCYALLSHSYFKPYLIDIIHGLIDNIQLLELKHESIGITYQELVDNLVEVGYIPLGLLRYNSDSCYVYTNCRKGDIVCQNDQVYVLELQ
ncbi:hypothetical protein HDV06_000997 [Boothiomyces sp. JEL0866]|nr:hypothetical protein HDV06_000997 [Boothiomyces sp. JEL0866]